MDYFFGLNASMSTFIVILFGYVAQIKLLYNGKKEAAGGVSLTLYGLSIYMLISWAFYGIYGFPRINWYITLCNILGTLLAIIITCQILYYRYFHYKQTKS